MKPCCQLLGRVGYRGKVAADALYRKLNERMSCCMER